MDISEAYGLEFLDLSGVDEYERNRVLASLQLAKPSTTFPWFIGDEDNAVSGSKPTEQRNLQILPRPLVKNHGYVTPNTGATLRRAPLTVINPGTGVAIPISSNLSRATTQESVSSSTVTNITNGPINQYFNPVPQYYSPPVVTTIPNVPVHIQPTTYGNYTVPNTSHHEIPVNTTLFPTYLSQSYPVKAPVYYGVPPAQPLFVSHQTTVDAGPYYQNSAPQYVQNVPTENTVVTNTGPNPTPRSAPAPVHQNRWVANESAILNNVQRQTVHGTVSHSMPSQNFITKKPVSPLSADTPAFTPKNPQNVVLVSQNSPTVFLEPQKIVSDPPTISRHVANPESIPTAVPQNLADTTPKQASTTPKQAHTTPRQAETTPKQAETTPKQAETTPKQADTTSKQTETSPKQADTTPKQADTTPKQADTTQKQADTTQKQAATTSIQAYTAPKPADNVPKQADTTPKQTDSAPEQADTTSKQADTTSTQADTTSKQADTTSKQAGVWGAGKSWASLFTPKEDAVKIQMNGLTKPTTTEAVNKESNNNEVTCPIKNPKRSGFIDPDCYRMGEFLTNYAVDGRAISLQPRGLINQSNYCYINSILQALIACPPMYNLLSGLSEHISSNAKRKPTPVIDGICKFVKEFKHLPANMRVTNRRSDGGKKDQKKDQGAVINTDIPFEPSWVYKMLNGIRTDLIEGRQEDAEEFLGCLLNNLNDEMLELIKLIRNDKTNEEPPTESKISPEEDDENWQVMGSKNKGTVFRKTSYESTPVTDVFGGSLKSRIYRAGDYMTEITQPFLTLQLNIEKVKTVREALEFLTTKYQLEGVTSSKTNEEVEAWQQVMLDELPVVLVLHLKCFDFKLEGCTKIVKALEFPVDLKIDGKILSSKTTNAKEKQYKLFAVVYHDGKEATKGHYVTDAFHVGYSSWLRYDDASVKQVPEEQVLNPQGTRVPYLLFYRRSDTIRSR